MLIWLFFLVAMLPFVAVAGLAALAAFSVLYLNGVAPDRFESEDLRRQRGPVLPSTRIGAIELLLGFLVMLFVPIGLLKLGLVEITAAPGSPERLAVQGLGLVAALVFLVGVDRLRGGRGMLPWGGGKISRPVFAFFAMLPMMALVAIWNRHLVEGLLGGLIPGELVEGMHELQGGAFWMSLSIALLIGPALEELLFRGAVFAAAARMAQAWGRAMSAPRAWLVPTWPVLT